jgi:hypothetical protein
LAREHARPSLEDLALAAALLLAALVEAGPATAQAAEPPPVSCIADNPVDPLGPGFLLNRGEFTTIDVPGALQSTAADINARGQTIGFYLDARAEDIGSAPSPLTAWGTVPGAASLQ